MLSSPYVLDASTTMNFEIPGFFFPADLQEKKTRISKFEEVQASYMCTWT